MEKFIKKEQEKRLSRIEIYRNEVLKLMYPKQDKHLSFTNACAKMLNNHGILDKADRKRLFREIGSLIKERATEKETIRDAKVQLILDNLTADRKKKAAAKAAKEKAEAEKFPLLRHVGLMDDDQGPETRV